MNLLILSFFLSLVLTLALIRYQHLHKKFSGDSDFSGPQKFHINIVPRVGGISIFLSFFGAGLYALFFIQPEKGYFFLLLIFCALPAFLVGLLEDITKKLNVKVRLTVTAVSAGLAGHFLNLWINNVGVEFFNAFLTISLISTALTIIAITGLANAYNIIDGFNGLASMIAIMSALSIGYIAFKVNDPILVSACLILTGGIAGFFVWNYPRGLIFLGDGGAYLIGFLIASLSILLVNRNPTVSPWFVLLINAYPIFETLFTIWRRKFYQGKNPGLADGAHFHSLIYRRLIRWAKVPGPQESIIYLKNAMTSPYLWLLSSLSTFPALIWWDTTWILQAFTLLFCASYIWIYNAIIKFKTPIFFRFFK